MRLISRKIWRAFPELDRYEDEVCRLYIRHARRLSNQLKGAVVVITALVVGFFLWLGLMFNIRAIVYYLNGRFYYNIDILENITADVITITGHVWFPILFALFIRDRWLIRSVRKQLRGVACAGCGYTLRGLEIKSAPRGKFVVCPECGVDTELGRGHISEADINPNLLHDT